MSLEQPTILIPQHVLAALSPPDEITRPIVVMNCGVSGSGKSTFAKAICTRFPSFTRLSIDQYIFENHGWYGVDYPNEMYSQYQDEASAALDRKLIEMLRAGKNLILDFSFWNKQDRDETKAIVEKEGGRWILVYLAASENRGLLKQRIQQRKQRREEDGVDGDCAFDVTDEVFDMYLRGFEIPRGEGELRLD